MHIFHCSLRRVSSSGKLSPLPYSMAAEFQDSRGCSYGFTRPKPGAVRGALSPHSVRRIQQARFKGGSGSSSWSAPLTHLDNGMQYWWPSLGHPVTVMAFLYLQFCIFHLKWGLCQVVIWYWMGGVEGAGFWCCYLLKQVLFSKSTDSFGLGLICSTNSW